MKFLFSINKKTFGAIAIMSLCANVLFAQSTFSTYSRFGIGIPTSPGSVTHFGMGGTSIAIVDGSLINFSNPASYSFCGVTTLQVNAVGSSITASTSDASMKYTTGQVNEFGLLFKKPGSRWAIAAGLTPYSTINYSLSNSAVLNDTTNANYIYNGSGGLNKFNIGTSRVFTIYKTEFRLDSLNKKDTAVKVPVHQISVGVNGNAIFGTLVRTNNAEFDDATVYNTREIAKLNNKGVGLDIGVLYKVRIAKKEEDHKVIGESHLYFGADFSTGYKMRSIFTEINSKYIYSAGAPVDAGDSYVSEEVKGRMTIPARIALGAAYRKSAKKWGRYTVAIDFKTQDWSNYKISFDSPFSQAGYLDNSSTLSAGFEFEPSIARKSDFIHRMSYRAGLRQTDTHLHINGTNIMQQAVSVGLSIPVVRSLSRFHIGAEYMTGGTQDNNLILEKGFNFIVGFTLTPAERWFFQRKYD